MRLALGKGCRDLVWRWRSSGCSYSVLHGESKISYYLTLDNSPNHPLLRSKPVQNVVTSLQYSRREPRHPSSIYSVTSRCSPMNNSVHALLPQTLAIIWHANPLVSPSPLYPSHHPQPLPPRLPKPHPAPPPNASLPLNHPTLQRKHARPHLPSILSSTLGNKTPLKPPDLPPPRKPKRQHPPNLPYKPHPPPPPALHLQHLRLRHRLPRGPPLPPRRPPPSPLLPRLSPRQHPLPAGRNPRMLRRIRDPTRAALKPKP